MVALLSVAVVALAALALWQQFRLRRLAGPPAPAGDSAGRALAVRRLHGPRIVMAPARSIRRSVGDRYASQSGEGPFDRGAARWMPGANQGEPPTALMENPDFLEAYQIYREGMLDSRYAELFRRLNLSPAELAAFKHLLAEKDNLALDVVAISENSPGGPLSPDQARAGMLTAQAENENSIRSALGNERYDQYRDFEDTIPQRATVAQLERRLSYSDAPLTAAQADSLVKVLADNSPRSAGGTAPAISLVVGANPGGVLPVVNPDATGLITDGAIEQAQRLLSPQQVAALRQLQGEQQAVMQAGRLIMDGSPSAQWPPPDWGLLLQ